MALPDRIRLGSRQSPLALRQASLVADVIRKVFPTVPITIHPFKTTGDRFLDARLSEVGDKGLFVKELEEALLDDRVDIAIHSMKDMPAHLPEGLALSSALRREDPRDAFLSRDHVKFRKLPAGAVIGTASLRRTAQLRRMRPDVTYEVIRGNVQTRYQKMLDGQFDAIVLAAAGIARMSAEEPEWPERITQFFDPGSETVPAAGQGILAVEFRTGDMPVQGIVDELQEPGTQLAMRAERAFLTRLEGGCQVPMGAYARPEGNAYLLTGIVLSPDSPACFQGEATVDPDDPESAGVQLAETLLAHGADEILKPTSEGSGEIQL